MTIGAARQRDKAIFVYDKEGLVVAIMDARDGLIGYSDKRVTVRSGDLIIDCDETGREMEVHRIPRPVSN